MHHRQTALVHELAHLQLHFMDMWAVMLVDILGALFAIVCLLCVKLNDPKKEYQPTEKADFWGEFHHGIRVLKKTQATI